MLFFKLMLIITVTVIFFLIQRIIFYIKYGQLLADITDRTNKILKYVIDNKLLHKYEATADYIPPKQVQSQFNRCLMINNRDESYTLNDGLTMSLCLDANVNAIMHVICHELAHMNIGSPVGVNEHGFLYFDEIMNVYVKVGKDLNLIKSGSYEYCKYKTIEV